jgi:tetratricopeptide (TPR) repeat protein
MFKSLVAFSFLLIGTIPAVAYDIKDCVQHKDVGLQIAACTIIIGRGGNVAWAYNNRGNAYKDKGDLAQALVDFDKSIELDPKNVDAYNNRGTTYSDKGDLDNALADYNKAIEINPQFAAAYNNRGAVYGRGGAYGDKSYIERPLADFTKAIELDPKFADAYNNRCWLRTLANWDPSLALEDCDEALRLAPQDANSFDTRGFVYLRLNRLNDAIADFNVALNINPKLASSLYGRGLAKQRKGNKTGGDADIAAAKLIESSIEAQLGRFGPE